MNSNQSPRKIRVLIVDDIPETRDNLRKLLQFEPDIEVVAQASTGSEGIELAKQVQPNIVLMDINMPGNVDGIGATEAITRHVPAAQIVMMSVQSESDYIRRSMLAGARDFLTKPFSGDELIATIRRVYERSRETMARMPTPQVIGGEAPPVTRGRPARKGKVIVVFSAKGGVGCSVIAANLAVAFAQQGKKTVALDASLAFGDLGVLLDLQGSRSLVDLVQHIDELDPDLVGSVLAAHGSGLKVLLGPPRPEMGELITADHLQKIIAALRARYEYVIVDTYTSLQDVMLTVLDQADRILLVATPDIPCIKDTRLFFEVVDQLDYERDKTMLMLNKVDKHAGISPSDIENTMKQPVVATIPADDRAVMFSVNQGVPVLIRDPGKPFAEAIKQLANQLSEMLEVNDLPVDDAAAETPGRSRLSRLFGGR